MWNFTFQYFNQVSGCNEQCVFWLQTPKWLYPMWRSMPCCHWGDDRATVCTVGVVTASNSPIYAVQVAYYIYSSSTCFVSVECGGRLLQIFGILGRWGYSCLYLICQYRTIIIVHFVFNGGYPKLYYQFTYNSPSPLTGAHFHASCVVVYIRCSPALCHRVCSCFWWVIFIHNIVI